jgi:hypothetical protein
MVLAGQALKPNLNDLGSLTVDIQVVILKRLFLLCGDWLGLSKHLRRGCAAAGRRAKASFRMPLATAHGRAPVHRGNLLLFGLEMLLGNFANAIAGHALRALPRLR